MDSVDQGARAESMAFLSPQAPGRASAAGGHGDMESQERREDREDRVWLFSSHFDGDDEWIDVEVCDRADAWSIEVAHTRAGSPAAPRRIEIPKGAALVGARTEAEAADAADAAETGSSTHVAERDELLAALSRIAQRHVLSPEVTPGDIADCAIECADAYDRTARLLDARLMPVDFVPREDLVRVLCERDHLEGIRQEQAAKLRRHLGELAELREEREEALSVLWAVEVHLADRLQDDRSAGIDDHELGVASALERVRTLIGGDKQRVAAAGDGGDTCTIPLNRPAPPFEDLDAGIRETVRWLFDHGFNPTDSGDGYSKRTDPNNPFFGLQGALDEAHVMMTVADPAELVGEVERLAALLEERGIVLSGAGPRTPEEAEEMGVSWEPLPAGVVEGALEGSYAPGGPAVIILTGVDDRALFVVGGDNDCDDGKACTSDDCDDGPCTDDRPRTTEGAPR